LHRVIDDVEKATVQLNQQTGVFDLYIPKTQKTIPDLMIGAGYNLLQTHNFFFPIMISYNVLYTTSDKHYAVYPRGWMFQLGFIEVF
jgi:hypothetical protein